MIAVIFVSTKKRIAKLKPCTRLKMANPRRTK